MESQMKPLLRSPFSIVLFLLASACSTTAPDKSPDSARQQPAADSAATTAAATADSMLPDWPVYKAAAAVPGEPLQRFDWAQGACSYECVFDNRRYSARQIESAASLVLDSYYLNTSAVPDAPGETMTAHSAELTAEYAAKKKQLAAMQLPEGEFWSKLKADRNKELEESYALKKLAIEASAQPALLAQSPFSKPCMNYASALASGNETELLAAWKQLLEEKKKKNGYPEGLQKRFDEQWESPDRLSFARYDLLVYGWWNCANHAITHVEPDFAALKKLQSLFVKVNESCDGP